MSSSCILSYIINLLCHLLIFVAMDILTSLFDDGSTSSSSSKESRDLESDDSSSVHPGGDGQEEKKNASTDSNEKSVHSQTNQRHSTDDVVMVDSVPAPVSQSSGGGVKSNRKGKTKSISRSVRAGVIFPVGRVERHLKELRIANRVSKSTAVYLAAVLEYVINEVIIISVTQTQSRKAKRIRPLDIRRAMLGDKDFFDLIRHATISDGGQASEISPHLIKDAKEREDRRMKNTTPKTKKVKTVKPKPEKEDTKPVVDEVAAATASSAPDIIASGETEVHSKVDESVPQLKDNGEYSKGLAFALFGKL